MTLTKTETAVLKEICRERTNREIAVKMNVSERTIERLRSRLYDISKSRGPIGLFKWAVRKGYQKFGGK